MNLKLKKIFIKNIIQIDAAVFSVLAVIFGVLFFVNPQKLSDSAIISPLPIVLHEKPIAHKKEVMGVKKIQEVIGFLPSWSVAQNVNIDVKKLTQLIYFGLGVNSNGEIVMYNQEKNPTLEWHYFTSENFLNLKQEARQNKTKVLVAFKMFNNENIDNLISNGNSTDYFIKNVLSLLQKYDCAKIPQSPTQ